MADGFIPRRAAPLARRLRHLAERVAVLMLALGIVAAIAIWWAARWTPDIDRYPSQGALISDANGRIAWGSVRAAGADFAYVAATDGAHGRDREMAANMARARAAGLHLGVVHRFDLCALASDQADNFIRHVPRDPAMLPPAVWLDLDGPCTKRPTRALLLSELTTFLAQIEAHEGKPAIIAPDSGFEAEYDVTSAINRTLWVRGSFFEPRYGAHPWVMWLANRHRRVAGASGTIGWLAVQEGTIER